MTEQISFPVDTSGMKAASVEAGKLSDNTKEIHKDITVVNKSLINMKTVLSAISVIGFAKITSELKDLMFSAVNAIGMQIEAETKLSTALINGGIAIEGNKEALVEYANELQRITAFSDDQIISSEALMATFGMSTEEIKAATKSAMDLSAALGIDLQTAALAIGKAFKGEGGYLSRLGINFEEALGKDSSFLDKLDLINSRFGGFSEKLANTPLGAMQQLKNIFDDVLEQIGQSILDSGLFATAMQTLRDLAKQFSEYIITNKEALSNLFKGMAQAIIDIGAAIPTIMDMFVFIVKNANIILPIMGALAGAQAGSIGGVWGAVIGAVFGLGGGIYASSAMGRGEVNIQNINVNQSSGNTGIGSVGSAVDSALRDNQYFMEHR